MLRSEQTHALLLKLYTQTIARHQVVIRCLVYACWILLGSMSIYNRTFEGIVWQSAQAASTAAVQQTAPRGAIHQPAQPVVALSGFAHAWQTLNNCGPAVLTINLSYYGTKLDQQTIAQTLRPNPNDQNVRPDELARYALAQGYQATLRVNGTADLLRLFLSNGIPIVIETWESDDPAKLDDGFAHFRLVTGYDDARQVWIVYDPYVRRNLVNPQGAYQGMYVPYAQADQLWRVTNRKYVVVYPSEKTTIVQSILGDDLDDQVMWERSLQRARAEMDQQPNDPFAWFNFGSSLYAAGLYDEAVQAFQKAQGLGLPTRMFWYQYEPFAANYAAGHYAELLQLVDSKLTTTNGIEELYYWKAMAFVALGDTQQADQALRQALAIKPNYQQALAALEDGLGGG